MSSPSSERSSMSSNAYARRSSSGVRVAINVSVRSGDEQQLSGSLPAFKIAVRLPRVCERIFLVDAQFEFSGADPVQNILCAPQQFLTRQTMMREARPRQI